MPNPFRHEELLNCWHSLAEMKENQLSRIRYCICVTFFSNTSGCSAEKKPEHWTMDNLSQDIKRVRREKAEKKFRDTEGRGLDLIFRITEKT